MVEEIMDKPSFGVIVGRFQVHELHQGHLELLQRVWKRHNRVILFLGCTKTGPTRRNPLDFETRKAMIQAQFPEFIVVPLQDKKSDEEWSKELDDRIADIVNFGDVTLYGSRDCFAPYYHGGHRVKELEMENIPKPTSSTEIRNKIVNRFMEDAKFRSDANFRAGVIYATGQMFPRCFPTVDVAIIADDAQGNSCLLLGKKPGEKLWRFIGGFADPPAQCATFEDDAKREVMEETGLDVEALRYIGSLPIADWRYKDGESGIKSLVFLGYSMTMGGRAADDIAVIEWHKFDDLEVTDFEPEHRPVFEMVQQRIYE
jgi:bifunctional NMN adenylyltransferase/nudix hydrolase